MRIIFWLGELSIHFSALLQALQEQGHEVHVCAGEEVSQPRKRLGWGIPDLGGCQVVTGVDQQQVRRMMCSGLGETVHITTGFRLAFNRLVVTEAGRAGARLGLHIEKPTPDGWRVLPKWVVYSRDLRRLRPHLGFLCAVGQMGVDWYRKCGVPPGSVFPIGYAVEDHRGQCAPRAGVGRENDQVRIIFLGQCIPRKRGDLLLHALAQLQGLSWSCDFVGGGPLEDTWRRLGERLGLDGRVRFLSAVPYDQVMGRLQQYDLFVLPSRFDGWGAVVNEALRAGLPVVCSSTCGAADLLGEPWRGTVFRSGSLSSLAEVLRGWMERGPLPPEERKRIMQWTDCITGASMATYLTAVLSHVYGSGSRPRPPWEVTEPSLATPGGRA